MTTKMPQTESGQQETNTLLQRRKAMFQVVRRVYLTHAVARASGSTETHFGQRVIAAIQALPADMRNDPAYADPVAWVKKARENTAPATDSDDE